MMAEVETSEYVVEIAILLLIKRRVERLYECNQRAGGKRDLEKEMWTAGYK